MPLHVYLDPCTVNSRKVLSGLELMNVPYEFHHIDYFKGEQKSDEFKKINPHATVPAAVDGDLTLTESNAILMYAADSAGGHAAYPANAKLRADINRWLLWEASVWFPTNYIYLVENVVKPLLGAQPDQGVLAKEAPNWNKNAHILEARLAKTGHWLCGEHISIADVAVAALMHLYEAARLPLESYPHVRRWLGQLEQIPAWRAHQAAVDKALLPHKTTNGASLNGGTADAAGTAGIPAVPTSTNPATIRT